MTHRERVLTALAHKEPDRVPIDIWGSASRVCNKLYFEIAEDQKWKEPGPCVKVSRSGDYVDDRISDLVGSDFMHINIGKPELFKSKINEQGKKLANGDEDQKNSSGPPMYLSIPLQLQMKMILKNTTGLL